MELGKGFGIYNSSGATACFFPTKYRCSANHEETVLTLIFIVSGSIDCFNLKKMKNFEMESIQIGRKMFELGLSSPPTPKRRKITVELVRSCCKDGRDWSGLPRNVLFDITDKLTEIEDFVRFGAVCRSWQAIFIQENSQTKTINKKHHYSQPFLLIPIELTTTRETTTTFIYNISSNRVYKFHFQLTGDKALRGSAFGWLVTFEIKQGGSHHVQLQNPFLPPERTIDLPALDNLVQQHGDLRNNTGEYYLGKAVLSADPSSSRGFTVMAIMSRYRGLAFLGSGATTWTSIGDWTEECRQQVMFHDVIFFHSTSQFYAIRFNGQVLAIDPPQGGGEGREPTLMIHQVVPPSAITSEVSKTYLAEDLSSGELLLVARYMIYGISPKTVIKVFKLHPLEQRWIRIPNLGGKVLFLGNNASMLRSTSDCPGCRPDCVYYTNDFTCRRYTNLRGLYMLEYYNGVYDLRDGTNRPHYSAPKKYSKKQLSSPIWLEPTVLVSASSMISTPCSSR